MVVLLLVAPVLTVHKAMKTMAFILDKSADQMTQMKVHCTLKRAWEQREFTTAHNYTCLNVTGLTSLLQYHRGTVPKGVKSALLEQWKAICIAGTKPAICLPWSDKDKVNL